MADQKSSPTPKDAKPKVKILDLIDLYTSRIRAIRRCTRQHVEPALAESFEFFRKLEAEAVARGPDEDGCYTLTIDTSIKEAFETHIVIPNWDVLAQSLLIFGFSMFDAFVGQVLSQLYRERRELIYGLEEKSVKVAELLSCRTIEEAVERLVQRDVSGLLRNSYDEIFSKLENRHSLSSLKKFASWPKFIEAAQRRNLVTHCDGIVNSQYLDACKNAGFQVSSEIVEGAKIGVKLDYLRDTLDILYEVGVKLAYTLWRKACPDQSDGAGMALVNEIFTLLTREEWHLARVLGEFASNMPGKRPDMERKLARINYAQALKWSGDKSAAIKVLDAEDWSSSIRDLRLGVEALRENYDVAASLMRDIGRKGELVVEEGYRTWPVFREFRNTPQFIAAFEEIYNTPFADEPVAAIMPDEHGGRRRLNCQSPNDLGQTTSDGDFEMPSERPADSWPEELRQTQPSDGGSE